MQQKYRESIEISLPNMPNRLIATTILSLAYSNPFKHPIPITSSCYARLKSMALHVPETEVVDAMDKLWFWQNILFYKPKVVSLQSKLTTAKSVLSTASSDENKKNDRRPERLNIAIGQPLFQLQSKAMSKLRSHSSSPSTSTGSHPKSSKRKGKVRSYKSLSELKNYKLEGFMDLGFTFPRDKLSAHMMSMIPGLQRLEEKERGFDERQVPRPYLSEAWVFSSLNSSLINLQMLPKTYDGDDMKRLIKFWARNVAMLVNEEP